MGGPGSGNWFRFDRKSTVEESLTLAVRNFRDRLHHGAAGRLTWTRKSGSQPSICYRVVRTGETPTVVLIYRWRDTEDVRLRVDLQTTPTQFDGRRWWFTCPLVVRGIPCARRVGKLYLAPGSRYFGCRRCHNLTYRSCQESHRAERLLDRLGFGPDAARLFLKSCNSAGDRN